MTTGDQSQRTAVTGGNACVIGWPIKHSRSPMIHGYWLKRYGLAGSYEKIAVPPEDLEEFLGSLQKRGFRGCNVTVPHKERAFALADVQHESATAVGAANTLWLEDGKLHAANTDGTGFITHLNASAPGWFSRDRPVTVLGAGGAARAILYALLVAGVSEVRLFNRTIDRALELAGPLNIEFDDRVKVLAWDDRSDQSTDSTLVVNTTSLGMTGAPLLEFDVAALAGDAVVFDIVYAPLETRLLQQSSARDLRTVDGLGMLLHQAVPGFEKWFGVRPEVTPELRNLVVADLERDQC